MGKISIGINLEFVRHEDKPFEWGADKAAELGYEYVEPMVHWGRELLSEAGYFHSVSMLDDPMRILYGCERAGVKISGLSAHCPLCKPEISTEYLKQAVRYAAEIGAPVVNTDEGPKPTWTTVEEDHTLMRYVLREALSVAEARGVLIGIEPHQQYSKTPDGLDRICALADLERTPEALAAIDAYLAARTACPTTSDGKPILPRHSQRSAWVPTAFQKVVSAWVTSASAMSRNRPSISPNIAPPA